MSGTDYAVPTGEYIAEWLEDNDISQAELGRRLGYSAKHVSMIIRGAPLSAEAAGRLELVTQVPAWRWLQLETQYRQDLDRLAVKVEAPKVRELLRMLPVPELQKRGCISHNRTRPGHCLYDLMAFFRVGSVDALIDRVEAAPLAAFRQGSGPKRGAVMSWLQIGELEAEELEITRTYRSENLERLIPKLRELSTRPPEHFGSSLVKQMAEVGVRLVYVPDFPGTATFGATRWFRGSPLIQLSLRRRTDDTFWFTLFHEIGHAVLHLEKHKGQTFVATADSEEDRWEPEADDFASKTLIPENQLSALPRLKSIKDVRAFAAEIGVAPGVVVGRLQHDGLWGWEKGNGLKTSLVIVED
jgi:HTH-type transcriptional regulator / antitoxin HigA